MAKKNKVYEGKTKVLLEADDSAKLIIQFSDNHLPPGAKKKSVVKGKGVANNQISTFLFKYLEGYNVPTHFDSEVSDKEMLVRKADPIKVKILMRNVATDDLVDRFGFEEGTDLPLPIMEYYLKDDTKDDPLINEYHIYALKLATQNELQNIAKMSLKINAVLKSFFQRRELHLVDFSMEFGRVNDRVVLIDEVSPDTCRMHDLKNGGKLNMFDISSTKLDAVYKDVLTRVID